MSSPRPGWVHPVGRVAVVGVLAAGIALGADRLGPVSAGTSPSAPAARVAATTTSGYCPGDPFADAEDGPTVDVTGSVTAFAAPADALDGVVTPVDEPGRLTLSAPSGPPSTADEKPSRGPTEQSGDGLGKPVMTRAVEEYAPGSVSGQSFVAGGSRATGLAAVPCTAPTADAWLVAGGGDQGRQEHLVLTNPGANPVTVEVDALGAKGEEGTRREVVPAHGRSVVLLDALGGTDGPQAVHVTSSGGLVVPTVVDHHLDGLTPAGVDTVAPTATPRTRHVIPASAAGEERSMVLGVPGGGDAVVEIRRVGADGSSSTEVTTVPGGEVTGVELPETEGVHSWVVESDVPVVAATQMRTSGAKKTSDMAWSIATPAIGTLGAAVIPERLPGDVSRDVEVVADAGPAEVDVLVRRGEETSTEQVSLEEGHSAAVPLGAADAVWVRPTSGSVHAAVLVRGRGEDGVPLAASVPVLPSRVAVRDVDVVHAR